MSALRRLALALAATFAVAALVIGSVRSQSGERSSEPTGSATADRGAGGLSAWAELLSFADHTVSRTDGSPSEAELDPASTVVILDPGAELPGGDVDALAGFLEAGGRLIVGGEVSPQRLEAIAGAELGDTLPGASARSTPLAPAPELAGVREVIGDGETRFDTTGEGLPLLGAAGAPTALAVSRGGGRMIALADTGPVRNGRLGRADNARYAIGLAGEPGRPVEYIEGVDAPPGEGLAALPSRWLWGAGFLLLAGLALIAARARRLAPPEDESDEPGPSRGLYLDAVAASLARARDPQRAGEILAVAARHRLARRAGLSPDAGPDRLQGAAEALGLEPEQIEAILDPRPGRADPLEAARALTRLSRSANTATEVAR